MSEAALSFLSEDEFLAFEFAQWRRNSDAPWLFEIGVPGGEPQLTCPSVSRISVDELLPMSDPSCPTRPSRDGESVPRS